MNRPLVPVPVPTWRDALTLPNALSLSRLLLGVLFPFVPDSWRVPVIVIAALSDLMDGGTARLLHTEIALAVTATLSILAGAQYLWLFWTHRRARTG